MLNAQSYLWSWWDFSSLVSGLHVRVAKGVALLFRRDAGSAAIGNWPLPKIEKNRSSRCPVAEILK